MYGACSSKESNVSRNNRLWHRKRYNICRSFVGVHQTEWTDDDDDAAVVEVVIASW